MIMAAFGKSSEAELKALFSQVTWYQKPSFSEFPGPRHRSEESRLCRRSGAMFQGITLVSVPVLSPSWEPLLILTAAGHSHDLDDDARGALSRAMQVRGGATVGEFAVATARIVCLAPLPVKEENMVASQAVQPAKPETETEPRV